MADELSQMRSGRAAAIAGERDLSERTGPSTSDLSRIERSATWIDLGRRRKISRLNSTIRPKPRGQLRSSCARSCMLPNLQPSRPVKLPMFSGVGVRHSRARSRHERNRPRVPEQMHQYEQDRRQIQPKQKDKKSRKLTARAAQRCQNHRRRWDSISHNVYYVRLRLTGLHLRRPALFVETPNLGRMHLSRLAPTCLHLPGTRRPASSRPPKCPFAIEPRPIRQQA